MILLSLLRPGLRIISNKPEATGISAVNEGVSEAKYPQIPKAIKTPAFIRLAEYGFIDIYLILKNNNHVYILFYIGPGVQDFLL